MATSPPANVRERLYRQMAHLDQSNFVLYDWVDAKNESWETLFSDWFKTLFAQWL